jgi:hypothetical protein
MPVCDGCGTAVDEAHIRRRIERIEQATRFRPIHIQFLLIDSAPPRSPADFFYKVDGSSGGRSVAARMYFTELAKLAGVKPTAEITDEATLAEFQRRGFFLAHAVECPVDGSEDQLAATVQRLAPTMLLRAQTSYKPKHIVLISQPTEELIKTLVDADLGEQLVLDGDGPFVDPFLGDPQNQAEFGTSLGDRIVAAISQIS